MCFVCDDCIDVLHAELERFVLPVIMFVDGVVDAGVSAGAGVVKVLCVGEGEDEQCAERPRSLLVFWITLSWRSPSETRPAVVFFSPRSETSGN